MATIEKCTGHTHPEPTLNERSALHNALYAAIVGIDKAWGLANRTPSLHDLTDPIGAVMAELTRIKRTV